METNFKDVKCLICELQNNIRIADSSHKLAFLMVLRDRGDREKERKEVLLSLKKCYRPLVFRPEKHLEHSFKDGIVYLSLLKVTHQPKPAVGKQD